MGEKMELTINDLKQLLNTDSIQTKTEFPNLIGKDVIIRTYSAGAHFGTLSAKSGNEVVLMNARRLWRFWCSKGIALSGVATHGVQYPKSKICEPVESIWLEAIEIIPCTPEAAKNLREAPHAQQE
jgi:hypothetical protein